MIICTTKKYFFTIKLDDKLIQLANKQKKKL